jgi:pyridoxine 5-phosphate synthase
MQHTNLSVNVNKIALLRNSRGANIPDLVQFALDCEQFGAEGITVHPRPDERHIRFSDVPALKSVVKTEFNIEGNPTPDFLQLVIANQPHQCTLVPDAVDQLTSDHGWDTRKHLGFLQDTIGQLHEAGIRVSIFIDPDTELMETAQKTGTDRIELYTGPYAHDFYTNRDEAVRPYAEAAAAAHALGLGINAGHDLNLDNLQFFKQHVPMLAEVSIGHALVRDALYYGIQNTIQMYLKALS